MDFKIFKKVVDKLRGVHTLILTGYGEPFCYDKIFEAIGYAKKKGFEVQLTTNGLLLDDREKLKKLISSGLDAVSFSLESINEVDEIIHDNLKVLDVIKKLIRLKEELNAKTPMVTIQTLIIKDREKDLFDIVKWGALNGAERINVARFDLNPFPQGKRPNTKEEREIFKQFELLRRKYKIRIDCIQDQMYGGVKGFLYKHFKYLLGMDKNCIRLQDFVYINLDGYLRPCCALVDHNLGNILKSSLEKNWNSREYKAFRKYYYKIPWCSKCDVFTLKQKV